MDLHHLHLVTQELPIPLPLPIPPLLVPTCLPPPTPEPHLLKDHLQCLGIHRNNSLVLMDILAPQTHLRARRHALRALNHIRIQVHSHSIHICLRKSNNQYLPRLVRELITRILGTTFLRCLGGKIGIGFLQLRFRMIGSGSGNEREEESRKDRGVLVGHLGYLFRAGHRGALA